MYIIVKKMKDMGSSYDVLNSSDIFVCVMYKYR